MSKIIDSSFVEREFYSEPPQSNATPAEWTAWLEREGKQRAAHKGQHTKSLSQEEAPEHLMGSIATTKQGGVHTQSTLVGFTGSAEEGTCQAEAVCPRPSPEALVDMHAKVRELESLRHKRGGTSEGKRKRQAARRRKNRKEARAGK